MYVGQFNKLIKNENISALVERVFHQWLGFQKWKIAEFRMQNMDLYRFSSKLQLFPPRFIRQWV